MAQLKRLLASLSLRQRLAILAVAALVGGGLFAFSRWRHETGFRALYTALAPEDAGAVVQKLKQGNVEYRLSDNGSTVLVPAAKMSELRLQMAMEGLPKTGRMGFELFDRTNFGVTDFAEHINYRRALEGELERSAGHLAEVEQARVHLTFPKDSVFLEAQQPAKASVLLRLRPGARLAPANVQAICHLVASAVEGLAPEAVSILDTRGNLLSRPHRTGSEGDNSDANLEYRQKLERDLLLKIRTTLDPLLGADRFQAGVSVDCDFSSGEQSEENFDPARAAMVSSQKSEENGPGMATAGIPGTASNLPRPTSAPTTMTRAAATRRSESIQYQPSRTVRRVRQPQGAIKRVSVALLVDQDLRWDGPPSAPRRVLVPPAPARLKGIRDLVAGIMSFDQARGDQLVVETLPFEATLKQPPPPPPGAERPSGPPWRLPGDRRLWILAAAAAALLFMVAVAAGLAAGRRRKKNKKRGPGLAPALAAAAAGSEAALAAGVPGAPQVADGRTPKGIEKEVLETVKLPELKTMKTEALTKQVLDFISRDSHGCSQVVRGWLDQA